MSAERTLLSMQHHDGNPMDSPSMPRATAQVVDIDAMDDLALYVVLPPSVRHDRRLTMLARLVWGELAQFLHTGVVTFRVSVLASAYQCDADAVLDALRLLAQTHHLDAIGPHPVRVEGPNEGDVWVARVDPNRLLK